MNENTRYNVSREKERERRHNKFGGISKVEKNMFVIPTQQESMNGSLRNR